MKFDVTDLQKSSQFDYGVYTELQSELAHRVKALGVSAFVSKFCTLAVFNAVRAAGMHCACYFLSFLEYFSNRDNVELPIECLGDLSTVVMPDFLLYSEGCSILYADTEDVEYAAECLSNALPEFLSRNLVVTTDAFDVL